MLKKPFPLWPLGLLLIFSFNSCEKKPKITEAPEIQEVTVALTPSNLEIKGELFTVKLSDLKIVKTVNTSTEELATTPSLKGSIKISNDSTNILDIERVTMQYLDSSGNAIPFENGEKEAGVRGYWSDIQPGTDSEASLDVRVPMAAVKEKSINKIRSHVVYIPVPLKKETMEFALEMEE